MNLAFFATLSAVIKHGSFARAAIEVNLSPSTVSLQMKRLEEYYGQPLFDRSGTTIKPTPLAHEVAGLISGTLDQMESLRRRGSSVIEGSVALGAIESMQAHILPDALRYIRQHSPRLSVRPVRDTSLGLLNGLKEGTIDAAIVAFPGEERNKRLDWLPLLQVELVLIAPKDSTEDSATALLQSHDLIRYGRGSNLAVAIDRYLAASGNTARGTLQMDSTHAILAMVSAGLGISILAWPDRRAFVGYPVREVRLGPHAPRMYFSLVTRKGESSDRVLSVIKDAVIHAADLAAGRNRWL
ncbi:LysR family transcriptional regulator [Bordetella sp. 15P40C-2]|uniref:LysR family transcriptional regulator n=1 Tax=Bordetella sp. 15P40C-2 TaxID=2572246 RepID=UPI001327AAA8|nr:LysR family transcriptional regulator [Bordetella sp. 15P40C-2]MVW70683.1 LysR family transcriptional regulator [Bordetella sp. 15P40C-2]